MPAPPEKSAKIRQRDFVLYPAARETIACTQRARGFVFIRETRLPTIHPLDHFLTEVGNDFVPARMQGYTRRFNKRALSAGLLKWRDRRTHWPPRSRFARRSCLHLRPDRCRRESEGPRLLSVWETIFSPIQRERRKGERASRAPRVGGSFWTSTSKRAVSATSQALFYFRLPWAKPEAIATAAGAH